MPDVATALPFVWTRPTSASAWTCNTVNWAMSYYTDVALPSMDVAVTEVGEQGTVVTSGGVNARAKVQTGRICADPQTFTGALRCMVTVGTIYDMILGAVYGDSDREEQYDYPIVANINEQPRPQRVRLGRGAKGNCWSFIATNPTGEHFMLSNINTSMESAGINRW
jgi:hypothetical protein